MALRQIEMIVARDEYDKAMETIETAASEDDLTWVSILKDGKVSVKTIMDMDEIESYTDKLEKRFHVSEGYRIIIHPVEAVLPRPVEPEPTGAKKKRQNNSARLSREELYSKAQDMCQFTRPIAALVVLSAIVAFIGLRMNSEVITLAAMIIAPLMGPHMALALATTLGDKDLARKSVLSAVKGISLAVAVALALGLLIPVDTGNSAIESRTRLDFFVVVLALASGSAGVVSFTSGAASALVGVMVSLAILPPLVASAILLAHGHWAAGLNAGIIFMVNIIGLNLASVATYLAHGIQPMSWWDVKRARKMTIKAIIIWVMMLLAMVAIIMVKIHKF
ncbi:TIGR00341 family protein [Fundidesulfovibrio soli]|uniref:TIGR00341 family protein n=1 Tax=Fundidesulfovibrio soli TaxID=2922716 RepID=UPI001FAE9A88|nr:TIGR00341 family protein [Fundidesulfovibrio soli]